MSGPEKPDDKKNAWTADDWKGLAEAVAPLVDKYIAYKKYEFDTKISRLNAVSRHNRRLTYTLVTFLTAVVLIMSYLTFAHVVSGESLLFLAGTVTGYVVLMVQDLTHPLFEQEPPEE